MQKSYVSKPGCIEEVSDENKTEDRLYNLQNYGLSPYLLINDILNDPKLDKIVYNLQIYFISTGDSSKYYNNINLSSYIFKKEDNTEYITMGAHISNKYDARNIFGDLNKPLSYYMNDKKCYFTLLESNSGSGFYFISSFYANRKLVYHYSYSLLQNIVYYNRGNKTYITHNKYFANDYKQNGLEYVNFINYTSSSGAGSYLNKIKGNDVTLYNFIFDFCNKRYISTVYIRKSAPPEKCAGTTTSFTVS